jgi:hypothetical protein
LANAAHAAARLTENNLVKWMAVKLGMRRGAALENNLMNIGETVTKSNVFYILDARMDKNERTFDDGVDSAYETTLAKYEAYYNFPKVGDVFNSMFEIMHSRLEMEIEQLPTSISAKELPAIQKQRDARSGAALEAFCAKVTNESDLDDPLVLAVFKAASDYLARYLRLLDQNCYEDDEAIATHHELERGHHPPKSRRRSQARTQCLAKKKKT